MSKRPSSENRRQCRNGFVSCLAFVLCAFVFAVTPVSYSVYDVFAERRHDQAYSLAHACSLGDFCCECVRFDPFFDPDFDPPCDHESDPVPDHDTICVRSICQFFRSEIPVCEIVRSPLLPLQTDGGKKISPINIVPSVDNVTLLPPPCRGPPVF